MLIYNLFIDKFNYEIQIQELKERNLIFESKIQKMELKQMRMKILSILLWMRFISGKPRRKPNRSFPFLKILG